MYVKFPKSFADELAPKLDGTMDAIRECLVHDKPLTVQQWSELNRILITVKVGLRSDEEHAKAMANYEEDAKMIAESTT